MKSAQSQDALANPQPTPSPPKFHLRIPKSIELFTVTWYGTVIRNIRIFNWLTHFVQFPTAHMQPGCAAANQTDHKQYTQARRLGGT